MPATAKLVRNYLDETNRLPTDTTPLLLNYRGEKMNRSGIRFLIDKYWKHAADLMPTVQRRAISPHTFRHYVPFRTMSRSSKKTSLYPVSG